MILLIVHLAVIGGCGFYLTRQSPFKKSLRGLLIIKLLAVPVYYWFYENYYGDFFHFDAGKYFRDALVLKRFLSAEPFMFFRYLTGFTELSDYPVILSYIEKTFNWDEGFRVRWIYNDNQFIILINVVLSFLSGENYFVHACWFCFFSWIGLTEIQRSLNRLYLSSFTPEPIVLYAGSLMPFVWFYSGAILKEPLILLMIAFMLKGVLFMRESGIHKKIKGTILFIFSMFVLRPPSMLLMGCSAITGEFFKNHRWNPVLRITILPFMIILASVFLVLPPISGSINAKRKPYLEMQQGGIFLKTVRMEGELRIGYDTTCLKKIPGTDSVRIIRPVPFVLHHPSSSLQDTLWLTDTLEVFKCVDIVRPARSTLFLTEPHHFFSAVKSSLQHLGHFLLPVHLNSLQEKLYALENLIILIALLWIICKAENPAFLLYTGFFILFIILTAYACPNIGTMARYRSIWLPELLMMASILFFRKKEILRNRNVL